MVKLKDYGNVDVCIGMEKMCMDITEVENINVESQTQGRGCNSVVKYLPSIPTTHIHTHTHKAIKLP